VTTKKPYRVVLLAYEGMNLIDLSGPLQALATASRLNRDAESGTYETIVASAAGGPVVTGPGLPVITVALAALDGLAIDTLIVPGGTREDTFVPEAALVDWIVLAAPEVRRVCSVCTGAFLLAAAGLLGGRRVTTHWDWAAELQTRYPALLVDPDPIFIKDGRLWTSAGVSAGIDLTLALIEEDFGHQLAIRTARQLVMFVKRPGGQSQFSVPLIAQAAKGGHFADLHAWIAAHLQDDLRVERLAEQAGMSPRTFARIYSAQLGRTPARTVEAIRLEVACRILESTRLPLKSIATEVGYGEEQNLRRVFQRQLGINPAEYRARFASHGNPA
jgi:transcriptional regulator GlxA family with amidase domain